LSVLPRTLRFRVVMMLLVAFLLSAGVFIWAMNRVVVSSNQQIESDGVNRDVARVRSAIEEQVAEVRGIAAVVPEHVPVGAFNAASVINDWAIDLVLETDAQGRVVREEARGGSETITPATVAGIRALSSGPLNSGLANLPNGPAAVASRSLANGGVLLLGRYLKPQEDAIARITQTDVAISEPGANANVPAASGASGVVALNANTNLGWTEINGIDGKPALLAVVLPAVGNLPALATCWVEHRGHARGLCPAPSGQATRVGH
jgi:hypothetical protein